MKVRHRPTVVDAVIWDGTETALAEMRALGHDVHFNEHGELVILTAEREPTVVPIANTVIRGTQGESYHVFPDIRAFCYEPLEPRYANGDRTATEIHAVPLADGTTVNIVAYRDGGIIAEVVGGRERFRRSEIRETDDAGVPSIRLQFEPVTFVQGGDQP